MFSLQWVPVAMVSLLLLGTAACRPPTVPHAHRDAAAGHVTCR